MKESLKGKKNEDYIIVEKLMADSELNLEEIYSTFITFFIAGVDTTTTMLSISLLYLKKHPEVKEKLLKEIKENEENGIEINYENFSKDQPTYISCFCKEMLRIHSGSSVLLIREALEDLMLGDVQIKKELLFVCHSAPILFLKIFSQILKHLNLKDD